MGKVTFVVEFEDGKEPAVNAGTDILGGKLVSVSWRDVVNEQEWLKCSERMPDPESKKRVCVYTPSPHEDLRYRFVAASLFKPVCREASHWHYMTEPTD